MTTIADDDHVVILGVDTHLDIHAAAVIDELGRTVATSSFAANTSDYEQLLAWASSFGLVVRAGVEGTGSYGAGLARFLTSAGVEVLEVTRPAREDRRRVGKTDAGDAIAAARVVSPAARPPSRRAATGSLSRFACCAWPAVPRSRLAPRRSCRSAPSSSAPPTSFATSSLVGITVDAAGRLLPVSRRPRGVAADARGSQLACWPAVPAAPVLHRASRSRIRSELGAPSTLAAPLARQASGTCAHTSWSPKAMRDAPCTFSSSTARTSPSPVTLGANTASRPATNAASPIAWYAERSSLSNC